MMDVKYVENEHSSVYYLNEFTLNSIANVVMSYDSNPDWNKVASRLPNSPNTYKFTKDLEDTSGATWYFDNSESIKFSYNIIALFNENNELLSYNYFKSSQDLSLSDYWILTIDLQWEVVFKNISIKILSKYARHEIATNVESGKLSEVHDFLDSDGAIRASKIVGDLDKYINATKNVELLDLGLDNSGSIANSTTPELLVLDHTGVDIPLGIIKMEVCYNEES